MEHIGTSKVKCTRSCYLEKVSKVSQSSGIQNNTKCQGNEW